MKQYARYRLHGADDYVLRGFSGVNAPPWIIEVSTGLYDRVSAVVMAETDEQATALLDEIDAIKDRMAQEAS